MLNELNKPKPSEISSSEALVNLAVDLTAEAVLSELDAISDSSFREAFRVTYSDHFKIFPEATLRILKESLSKAPSPGRTLHLLCISYGVDVAEHAPITSLQALSRRLDAVFQGRATMEELLSDCPNGAKALFEAAAQITPDDDDAEVLHGWLRKHKISTTEPERAGVISDVFWYDAVTLTKKLFLAMQNRSPATGPAWVIRA